jgi:2-polyprenyl-6-methoxyphenol hydroxylase-like FAD-dependent oxidoreductase
VYPIFSSYERNISTEEQKMKALIAGGGVAGPVTAMALQRAGIDAVVYEAHVPSTEEVGSYLGLASNGLDALRAIDADKPVLAAGFPTATNILLSGTGRRLGAVSNGGRLADGTVSHTIKRPRLYRALHDEAAARGIDIEHGRRLVGAEAAAGGGVVATFEDGTRVTGDLLVGADGVHSATRRLLDPAAPAPRYVGLVNFGGYTPGGAGAGEPGAWQMIFGRRAFFGYVDDLDGGTVWFANVPRPAVTPAERAATTPEQWRRQLMELFAADHGPAGDLIADGFLELAGDSTYDLPSVPTWHRGPMVIVGDAAHAPSPTSGQGASMAAEDAVVLAQCLRDLPTVGDALAAYEGLRRRRVERIVAQGARTGRAKTPGPLGRVLRDLTLPLVFKLLVTERSQSWIHDHHIDWDTPVAATAGAA